MNKHYFFDRLKRFFSLNKGLCIFILILLLLGFMTGVLCLVKSNMNIDFNLIQNFILRNFLLKKYSILTFTLLSIIISGIVLFLFFLASFVKFGKIIGIICGLFFAYLIGIDCAILFCASTGIFHILLGIIYPVFSLAILFLMLVFFFQMNNYCRQMTLFGNCSIRGDEFKVFLFFLILITCISIILGIVMAILIKIFVFY